MKLEAVPGVLAGLHAACSGGGYGQVVQLEPAVCGDASAEDLLPEFVLQQQQVNRVGALLGDLEPRPGVDVGPRRGSTAAAVALFTSLAAQLPVCTRDCCAVMPSLACQALRLPDSNPSVNSGDPGGCGSTFRALCRDVLPESSTAWTK